MLAEQLPPTAVRQNHEFSDQAIQRRISLAGDDAYLRLLVTQFIAHRSARLLIRMIDIKIVVHAIQLLGLTAHGFALLTELQRGLPEHRQFGMEGVIRTRCCQTFSGHSRV